MNEQLFVKYSSEHPFWAQGVDVADGQAVDAALDRLNRLCGIPGNSQPA